MCERTSKGCGVFYSVVSTDCPGNAIVTFPCPACLELQAADDQATVGEVEFPMDLTNILAIFTRQVSLWRNERKDGKLENGEVYHC